MKTNFFAAFISIIGIVLIGLAFLGGLMYAFEMFFIR